MSKPGYRLHSSPGRYLTGHLDDGRQVLMGVICPHYVMFFFDADGEFVQVETRQLSVPPSIRDGVYYFDPSAEASLEADIARWTSELSLMEGPIEIARFDANDVFIEDFPAELMELEEEPENFDDAERDELIEWKAEWIASGMYALWWGDELWIDSDGTVNTS